MRAVTAAIDVLEQLRDYVRPLPDGHTLDWVTTEMETGVTMSTKSKMRPLLKRALRLEKRDFETIHGKGLRLSSPVNSIDFVHSDVVKISAASKKAQKRAVRLIEKHGEEMPELHKKLIIAVGAFHGTVGLAVASTLGTRPQPAPKPPAPVLPFRKKT